VSEGGVLPGLWPIPGDGVLARQGDLILLIHPAGGAFTNRLLDLLAGRPGPGRAAPGSPTWSGRSSTSTRTPPVPRVPSVVRPRWPSGRPAAGRP
jgi:hypothetical protein